MRGAYLSRGARRISARHAEAEALFARKVRGQTTVLRFVNRRRNNSEILPEHAAEVRRTRKAPRKCDVRDGFSGLRLQLLAAVLQPCVPDIVADGGTPVAEQHVQIALGAAQCRRDLVDGKIRVTQMFADEELRPDIHRLGSDTIKHRVGLAEW